MSYWKVLLEKWKAFICNKKRKGKNGLFYIGGSDTLPPPLSAEEEQQVSTIMSDISTYVQEETIKAITDGAALANWDNTVRQIYSMGIEDALSIYQTGYDRYNDR